MFKEYVEIGVIIKGQKEYVNICIMIWMNLQKLHSVCTFMP